MFDTMTLTKIVGGLCGAFLVFLLGKFVAEEMYLPEANSHDEQAVQGYMIETASADDTAKKDTGPTFEEAYADASVKKGKKLSNKCKACHKFEDGVDSTGPYLFGVVGRPVDSAKGYNYTGALEKVVDVWTPDNLNKFLTHPQGFAPGTAMTFAGFKKVQDRANVIAYLATLHN